jgi:hypothetical protein
MFYLLAGVILGVTINVFLSIDFLAHPSIDFAVASIVAYLIVFYRLFWRVKNMQNSLKFSKKLRFLFLGVSIISLSSAAFIFFTGSLSYLPTYLTDAGQSQFGISPTILIGVFKSLFLSGLFSFFERLLNIMEK